MLWKIDPHGKHISAEVTAVKAKEPTIKSQALKQLEESKETSFLSPAFPTPLANYKGYKIAS